MRKLAVLCAALLGSVILVSCGSDGGSSGGAPARPDMGTAAPAIAPGLREQAPSPSDSTATDSAERKEVITGSVDITSDDPIAAAGRVAEQVRALDGRIDSRTEQPGTDDNDPSATLTVRVPADRTDSFVDGLGGIGTVTRVSTDRDDVTMQWEDLDARIRALRASVDRLRALIENASSTADLIDAEEALSSRQGELDSLTAQQRRLDDQVALSTLTLSITAPGNGTGDDPDTFLDGLVAGWNSLIDWLEDAIVFAGKAIPWLGFLAVLGGLFWGVRRLIRRPRRAAGPVAATAATGDAATGKTAPDRKSDPSGKADPSGKTDVPGTTGLPGRTVEEKSEGAGGSGADRGAGDDQTEQP
ncbi:MAG TPA: DUF4349 domain-containing protein [Nocardia sp.]|uniref:DUF4349 domain-containing protein n=1 Tax=Nocardia sp. TaxID=1821 RepID=UPI002B4AF515|nr:DUF4349 domain-containing protein [Nocardia sp.]HLS78357.1 DUF4349 domain-containing protein [Nocardia sp.]